MSDQQARNIHDGEQLTAAMRNMGAGFGAMFQELIKSNMREDHATDVVCEYIRSVVALQSIPRPYIPPDSDVPGVERDE